MSMQIANNWIEMYHLYNCIFVCQPIYLIYLLCIDLLVVANWFIKLCPKI